MTERYYRIADIPVLVRREVDKPISLFCGFEEKKYRDIQLIAEIYEDTHNFHKCYGIEYCITSSEYPYLISSQKDQTARMLAAGRWDKLIVEGCGSNEDALMELFLTGFYSYASFQGNILMHASSVKWNSEAIIFTASSGTGKTTQAELWEKYKNALILNGDKMFVKCFPDRCFAWGSPWRGSSPYAVNEKSPLKAIVVLRQAATNSIRQLGGMEALEYVAPHLFYTSWSQDSVKAIMKSFDCLLNSTPVYLLSCRPDREAVEMTCSAIWGE